MDFPIHIHLKNIDSLVMVLIIGVTLICINEFTTGRMWVGLFGALLMLIGLVGIIGNWFEKR